MASKLKMHKKIVFAYEDCHGGAVLWHRLRLPPRRLELWVVRSNPGRALALRKKYARLPQKQKSSRPQKKIATRAEKKSNVATTFHLPNCPT
jgi:hypothetical protein